MQLKSKLQFRELIVPCGIFVAALALQIFTFNAI